MSWDAYFRRLCDVVASNSRCLSRKIGVVIADRSRRVLSVGYNGPPMGVPHCEPVNGTCRRRARFGSGEGLEYCPAAHAETNAIILGGGRERLKDSILYINTSIPCKNCLIQIIQAGIAEIVCTDTGKYYDHLSGFLLAHSNLIVRKFEDEG